jgi:class 3 adenylate cyclase/tetratricopeptide (TPR) repeat protein
MDVSAWLCGLGLERYEMAFRDNAIDGEVLPSLTSDDLKEIGVSAIGHRPRMLDAIAALRGEPDRRVTPAGETQSPAPPSRDSAERRPITVMFCDLVGSTSLAAKLDAEDWRDLVGAYLDEASSAVTQYGGHVLKKLGDGMMALFGYPKAQENDAERAARAGLAILHALEGLNIKNEVRGLPALSARIGLESGPVVVDSTGEVFGDAPNVAARVQSAAEPGTVLVTAAVQRQVAGLFVAEERGPHELKGVPGRPTLYRLVRASGGGRRLGARSLTTFIGREEELSLLSRRWRRATAGDGQFVQIVGEPGLGKSRLTEEFRLSLGDTPHTWSQWASSQLLQNTPLHPLADWGRQRFASEAPFAELEAALAHVRLDPAMHAPLLAPLLDIPMPEDRALRLAADEMRRKQLAALVAWVLAAARIQPLVLAFEDLHWADPTSLDLMKTLAERGVQAPLMIVATSRPEFRASWTTRSHHSVIALAPLDRAQIGQMVRAISERQALTNDVVDGLRERTAGVPLFIEELTRLMLEDGAQTIPPTLQQSLAARLDRLGEAREVAQIGAVLGREFSYTLLAAVSNMSAATLEGALDRLADADLLFVEGTIPASTYRFKHALIQDAAYESLLKNRRQALHRLAANALLAASDPRPELVAHHFTKGLLTDTAIEYWRMAGERALQRSANAEAFAHLTSAIDLVCALPTEGRRNQLELRLQMALGSASRAIHGHAAPETLRIYSRARDLLDASVPIKEQMAVLYGAFSVPFVRGEYALARPVAEQALEVAAKVQDPEATAFANRMMGITEWVSGEFAPSVSHLVHVAELYAPEAGNLTDLRYSQDHAVWSLSLLALSLWPLGEIDRAIKASAKALARAAEIDHAMTTAFALIFGSVLCEFIGADPLRDGHLFNEALDFCVKKDLRAYLPWSRFYAGLSVDFGGDHKSGLEMMRTAMDAAKKISTKLLWTPHLCSLASAHMRFGAPELALEVLSEGLEAVDAMGERMVEAELHRVRADALLSLQRDDESEAEYAVALNVARKQQARSWELRAAACLARLKHARGNGSEAREILAPVYAGFTEGLTTPDLKKAKMLLESFS